MRIGQNGRKYLLPSLFYPTIFACCTLVCYLHLEDLLYSLFICLFNGFIINYLAFGSFLLSIFDSYVNYLYAFLERNYLLGMS